MNDGPRRDSQAGSAETPHKNVRSIERSFDILRALALGPSGLTDIAERTGLAKSTCLRILVTLENLKAVQRDERGIYSIGPGIAELARFGDSTAALIVVLRPHLRTLAAETGETAGFGVKVGDRVQHLVQEEAIHAVQVRDYTGHSVPLHVSAAGIAILACLAEKAVERYLASDLDRYTTSSVVDPDRIRSRLAAVREQGYVWAIEEFAEGLSSVASPVFDQSGALTGAISVHGPSYRFPNDRPHEVGALVRAAALRLSARRSA